MFYLLKGHPRGHCSIFSTMEAPGEVTAATTSAKGLPRGHFGDINILSFNIFVVNMGSLIQQITNMSNRGTVQSQSSGSTRPFVRLQTEDNVLMFKHLK